MKIESCEVTRFDSLGICLPAFCRTFVSPSGLHNASLKMILASGTHAFGAFGPAGCLRQLDEASTCEGACGGCGGGEGGGGGGRCGGLGGGGSGGDGRCGSGGGGGLFSCPITRNRLW